jgi:hypothetical protein
MIHGNAFGDQIFFDHLHQMVGVSVLGRGSRLQTLRIEIRLATQLVDAFRHRSRVFAFVFGVLVKFLFNAVAGNPGRGYRVHGVAKHANDLSGQYSLQDGDGFLRIALVPVSEAAVSDVSPSALSQGRYVR